MASAEFVITILDMPEILELIEECLQAVPEWERAQLRARLEVILERARQRKRT